MNSRQRSDFLGLNNWPAHTINIENQDTLGGVEEWPLVSMVTPSFNQGEYLEACIQSVLHQDYPCLEYFILDGGSTDFSVDVIQKYSDHLAGWASHPDSGQSDAINQGWQKSTGKYIGWLNSDDMLMPGSIAASVNFLEQNPDVDMVYGDLLISDRKGRLVDRYYCDPFDLEKMLLQEQDISQPGSLLRREVIQELGLLNPDFHFVMDLEFWQRMVLSRKTLRYLPKPLAIFRVYDDSKTQAGASRAVEERRLTAESVLRHPNCPSEVSRLKRKIWFNVSMASSRAWLKQGQFIQALRSTLNAVIEYPRGLSNGKVYYTLFLSVLGVLVGWKNWLELRSRVRAWRRNRS